MNKIKKPDWFNGEIYKKGGTVHNPFTGEPYKLNNIELSIYDFIMGAQMAFEGGFQSDEIIVDFQKALTWRRISKSPGNPIAVVQPCGRHGRRD